MNSKITSAMSCVEGRDQRNVGNLFWKLQPLLICGFAARWLFFIYNAIDPKKMNISKTSLVFILWCICREKNENGSNWQQNWCENC